MVVFFETTNLDDCLKVLSKSIKKEDLKIKELKNKIRIDIPNKYFKEEMDLLQMKL